MLNFWSPYALVIIFKFDHILKSSEFNHLFIVFCYYNDQKVFHMSKFTLVTFNFMDTNCDQIIFCIKICSP